MKKNLLWLVAMLSCGCVLAGGVACNSSGQTEENSSNYSSLTSDGSEETSNNSTSNNSTSDDPSSDTSEEKEFREVDLFACSLDTRYFTGDRVTVENASLNYDGALQSDYFEIIFPDGTKSQEGTLTFTKAGQYKVIFYAELYRENIYGVREIEVLEWQDSYATLEITAINCKDKVFLGNTFIAPEQATVNYFGVQKTADFVSIEKPDGTIVTEDAIAFDKGGEYYIVYQVTVNGRVFTAKKTVATDYQRYAVSGEKSETEYGYSGINLALAEGEEFIVNQSVNLNDMTKNDTLISLKMNPSEENAGQGLPDALILNIKLTDIYNPDNYVIIQVNKRFVDPGYRDWADPITYMYAGGAEQTLGGINSAGNLATSGHETNFSMVNNPANQTLTISFDYETRQVHVKEGRTGTLITDLDDPNYYNSNFDTVLWEGFTTDEVYLSMWAEDYYNADKKMNLQLLNVCGFDTSNYKSAGFASGVAKATYEKGTEMDLSEEELFFEGETYAATASAVIKPNGTVLENPTELILEDLGTYKIIYTAEVDGEIISAVYLVNVVKTEIKLSLPTLNEYKKGSVVTLPAGTCEVDGNAISADISVKAPSGGTVSITDNKLTLSEAGVYEVSYSITLDTRVVTKKLILNSVSKVTFASSATTANSVVLDARNYLTVTVGAQDVVTVNKVLDWSAVQDSATTSTYAMFLFYFENMLATEYSSSDLIVRVTNVENIHHYVEIKYTFYRTSEALPAQMLATITYVNGTESVSQTHWFNKYAGSDNSYLKDSMIMFGVDGLYDKGQDQADGVENRAQGVMIFEDFFNKGIVTFSSESGIVFTVSDINNEREWLNKEDDPTVDAMLSLSAPLVKEYAQNSEVKIPAASFMVNGEKIAATVSVKDPEGTTVTMADNKLMLSKLGTYTLVYTATLNEQTLTESKTIKSVSNVLFATYENADSETWVGQENNYFNFRLAAGDTITLNKVFDWSNAPANASTKAFNMFTLYFVNMSVEQYQNSDLTIRITSVEDANDYVEIGYRFYNGNYANTNLNAQIVMDVWYFVDGVQVKSETHWYNCYAGYNSGANTASVIYIGQDGLYDQTWATPALTAFDDFFTKGVITLSSKKGICVAAASINQAQDWKI